MFATLLFLIGLATATCIGVLYFRDLGDVTQMVMKVKRENMLRFIRNEYRLLGVAGAGLVLMNLAHWGFGGGPRWLWWAGILLNALLLGFPWIWVHVGLRNQKDRARFVSVAEAQEWLSPSSQVLVIQNGQSIRAHPDAHLMRPHLAGDAAGLGGENVIMTYCAMANLGLAYRPEIAGEKADLEVLAQHGNNLILRDNASGQPIQQITGCPESQGQAMMPWPTFRMSFRGLSKAFPQAEVFINPPAKNPILRLFDHAIEMVFASEISRQHRVNAPIIENMTRAADTRLHNKTYVWGVEIAGDAVCWTDDFVIAHGNAVNAQVGGVHLVVAWDPIHESLGVFYNATGGPVAAVDVFGKTVTGQELARFEGLRPGLFWHVWAEFFPGSDINRQGAKTAAAAA
ncbi:MAG: DUF3179 domain-containing protein [Mangrovicoccus sp.]|nr:DUF3179 domain-containing protein [Mangrovicoccus sp.]